MPKTLTITCDVCDADITRASKIEVSYKDSQITVLTNTLYFCGYEHMYQFLDSRRPEKVSTEE